MVDLIPTRTNIRYYRGDGGDSSRQISFTHPFAAVDVTEARLYVRDAVDGTLRMMLKLTTHASQWDLSVNQVGSVTPAPDDTNAMDEQAYRYDIEVQTATAKITAQEGVWFCDGDISTDVAGDTPPSNEYHVSTEQRDALDGANSPSGSNAVATMDDISDVKEQANINRTFAVLFGTITRALTWSAAQVFSAAVTMLKLIVNQTGIDDIADFQDGGVSVVKILDGGGLMLVAKAGGFTDTSTGVIGYDSTRKRLVFQHDTHPGSVPVDPRNGFLNTQFSGTY